MTHSCAEVSDARVCLLAVAEIALRNEDVSHREHAEAAKFFRSVEDHRWESAGHLRVEAHLDASLDFVLAFDQQVQHLLSVDCCFAEVGHQADQSGVPFVRNLSESCATTGH